MVQVVHLENMKHPSAAAEVVHVTEGHSCILYCRDCWESSSLHAHDSTAWSVENTLALLTASCGAMHLSEALSLRAVHLLQ